MERLPRVLEREMHRITVTWLQATVTEDLVFGYTDLPSQTIPKGMTGWFTYTSKYRGIFVPDEEGDWPETSSITESSVATSDEFVNAGYELPDWYWDLIHGEGSEDAH